MQVVLLCGGRGVIDPKTRERVPKAMLRFGGRPLIWHVMKCFAAYGHKDFVLALGEGSEEIRRYFFEFKRYSRDVSISLETDQVEFLNHAAEDDWSVTLVDTGAQAETGARLARVKRYIEGPEFWLSYSDCLCNVNLDELAAFHHREETCLTVTGVQPTSRFGAFIAPENKATGYNLNSRLVGRDGYINGGFMLSSVEIFRRLEPFNECKLEREIFARLAQEGLVSVFPHDGYWQAVDTERDLIQLESVYNQNLRPWLPEASDFI